MKREATLVVRTPEGVAFSFQLASPAVRCLAWSVDLGVVLILTSVAGTALSILSPLSPDWALALSVLAYFVLSMGYGMVLEWKLRGQTLGKRLFRLRVMDAEGLRLMPQQIVVRNVLRFVDILPACYFLGGAAALLSPRCQRLGDLAAGTLVARQPPVAHPDLAAVLGGKYNSFLAYPNACASLRRKAGPQEADLALRAVLRRDALEPSARLDLFAELAGHFKQLVSFPQECLEGLTDEQVVRNAVDVLFRSRPGS